MGNNTKNGLSCFMLGTGISIFATLFAATGSPNNPLNCLIGFITIISFIFILAGLIMLIKGWREFGEEHRKFVENGSLLIFFGIMILVLGAFFMVGGALSGVATTSGSQEPTINYSQMARGMTNGLIISQVGGIVILLGEILLVYKLENKFGRELLFLTFFSGILFALFSTIFFSSALIDLMDTLEETPQEKHAEYLVKFQKDINIFSSLSLFNTLLLLGAYYIPYKRIEKGELKPVSSDYYNSALAYPLQYSSPPPPPDPNVIEVKPLPYPPPPPPPPSKEKIQLKNVKVCPNCKLRYPRTWDSCPVCGRSDSNNHIKWDGNSLRVKY
jgi:hypothetical protein